MSEDKKSFFDHVADGVGSVIEGSFYCVGRGSPAVADAVEALASTRAGKHVVFHAHRGWVRGWNATLQARERRKNRAGRAKWGDKWEHVKKATKATAREVVDCMQEDMRAARGEGPNLRPVPGEA